MKIKSPKSKRAKEKAVLGRTPELPEGVFGVTEPEQQPRRREKDASPAVPARKHKAGKSKKVSIKKRRAAPVSTRGMDVPEARLNEDVYSDHLPDLPYENTVKVPEELLKSLTRKSSVRTKQISALMMGRMMPSMMGLDAAQAYVTAAMRDALGIELDMDETMQEIVKGIINMDMVFYFLRRSTLPKKYKRLYLKEIVSITANKNGEMLCKQSEQKAVAKKKMADLQSIIVRGMSDRKNQPGLDYGEGQKGKRKRPNMDAGDMDPTEIFGLMDQDSTRARGNIGTMRRTPRRGRD